MLAQEEDTQPPAGDNSKSNVFGTLEFTPNFGRLAKKRKPAQLAWKNIQFSVGKREILKGLSGKVECDQLCALLGKSGAGKTSLLSCLAGRIISGKKKKVSGELLVNGEAVDPVAFRKNVAFVMQEDALFATATAREALEFSAELRLPASTSHEERSQLVDDLIKSLGLEECQNTFCGSELVRGLSGGEKKRVSIGVELVTNPQILCVDEGTSGLDSHSAWKVIKILQALSRSGCAVLCTIHQPSSEIFSIFDKVIMLNQGRVMYQGLQENLPMVLEKNGFPIPDLTNPADFIMVLAQTRPDDELPHYDEDAGDTIEIVNGDGKRTSLAAGKTAENERETSSIFASEAPQFVRSASWSKQTMFLARREFKNLARDRASLAARLGITIFLNVLFGCIFFQAAKISNGDYTLFSHYGALVNMFISALFGASQAPLLEFPIQRVVFLREYSTGTYASVPYFISKICVELPLYFFMSLLVLVISHPMIHFNGNFGVMLAYIFLIQIVSASYAFLVGALVSSAKQAQEFAPLLFVPQLLFAGFFIQISQIPSWLRWVQYLCSLKYAVNLAMIVELGGDLCFEAGGGMTAEQNLIECQSFLERNDVDEDLEWLYILILIAIFIVFRTGSLIALIWRARHFTT